ILDGWDVLLRHPPADDLVLEVDVVRVRLVALLDRLRGAPLDPLRVQRHVAHVDDGELAATTRLLDEPRLELDRLGQRLSVGHPRLAERKELIALFTLRQVQRPPDLLRPDLPVPPPPSRPEPVPPFP